MYPWKKAEGQEERGGGCERVDREEDGGKEGREENTDNITGLEIHFLIFISFYFLRIALWLPHSSTGMKEAGGGAQWRQGWKHMPTFTLRGEPACKHGTWGPRCAQNLL